MKIAQARLPGSARSISPAAFAFFFAAAAALLLASACGKDAAPTGPAAPSALTPVRATVLADYTFGQGRASGEVTFQSVSPPLPTGLGRIPIDVVKTGRLGEAVDLGAYPPGMTLLFDIEVRADGALTRIFRGVPLSGEKALTTDVLRLSDIDWAGFWHPSAGDPLIGPDHKNLRFNDPWPTVYFAGFQKAGLTPGGNYFCGVGGHLAEWARTIWAEIQANSAGFIRGLRFVYQYVRQISDPVYAGDVFLYYRYCAAELGQPAQAYLNPDGSINALVILLDGDPLNDWRNQILDSLFPGAQPSLGSRMDYIRFLFSRPAGDESSYRLYEDHEEQAGFTGTIAAAGATSSRRR